MLAFLEARSHSWLEENLILLSRTLAMLPNFVSTTDLTSMIFHIFIQAVDKSVEQGKVKGCAWRSTLDPPLPVDIHPVSSTRWHRFTSFRSTYLHYQKWLCKT